MSNKCDIKKHIYNFFIINMINLKLILMFNFDDFFRSSELILINKETINDLYSVKNALKCYYFLHLT